VKRRVLPAAIGPSEHGRPDAQSGELEAKVISIGVVLKTSTFEAFEGPLFVTDTA
jgi:hypothetical protein